MTYPPREFGKLIGRSVSTLQKWDRAGVLSAHRSPTGRRYYTHDQLLDFLGMKTGEDAKTVVYARVSSHGQKPDLQNQREAIKIFCAKADCHVDERIELSTQTLQSSDARD